jgi:tRNA dimethylallyltransferase
MIKSGLIEETNSLISKGYDLKNSQPMASIGYKQCFQYINGEFSDENELKDTIVRETMRLAKAQRTWFNGIEEYGIKVLKFHPIEDRNKLLEEVINDYK